MIRLMLDSFRNVFESDAKAVLYEFLAVSIRRIRFFLMTFDSLFLLLVKLHIWYIVWRFGSFYTLFSVYINDLFLKV